MTPWLRLVDSFPEPLVARLAQEWLLSPALRDRLSGMDGEAAQRALEQFEWLLREISTR